jgi:hypothetical protein
MSGEPECVIEVHGNNDLCPELRSLHCVLIGNSYFTRLKHWLSSPANIFYPNNFGIDRIGTYTWLANPGWSIVKGRDAILQASVLRTADIIIIDLAGNDLDDGNTDHSTLFHRLSSFVDEIRCVAPSATIVCLQLLRRLRCRSKSVNLYNDHVTKVNRMMRARVQTSARIWWWSHKALWGSDAAAIYKQDGVHLSPLGMQRYLRSIRGAVLCVIKAHF